MVCDRKLEEDHHFGGRSPSFHWAFGKSIGWLRYEWLADWSLMFDERFAGCGSAIKLVVQVLWTDSRKGRRVEYMIPMVAAGALHGLVVTCGYGWDYSVSLILSCDRRLNYWVDPLSYL